MNSPRLGSPAFTLVETLAVMGVIVVIVSLVGPPAGAMHHVCRAFRFYLDGSTNLPKPAADASTATLFLHAAQPDRRRRAAGAQGKFSHPADRRLQWPCQNLPPVAR